jgi:hypothetical protein
MLPEVHPVGRWVLAANPAGPVADRPALQVARLPDRQAQRGAASPEVWAEAASPAEGRPAAADVDVNQRSLVMAGLDPAI